MSIQSHEPLASRRQRGDPRIMTRLSIFRPAAAHDGSVQTVITPEDDTSPARPKRPWWRRLYDLDGTRQSLLEIQHTVLERVLALLEGARADLPAGWVQDGWWATPADSGQRILVTGLAAGAATPHRADAVCLVGALVRAGAAQGADSEIGRAVDAVYEALWESNGQPPTATGMLTLSSPQVLQARIQSLARWNDTQGRTSDEILLILDRAIARVIQALAALPAPRAAAAVPS